MAAMAYENEWTLWDPFLTSNGMTADQRTKKERAEAWEAWSNGGIGEPFHFDYTGWHRMNFGRDP